MKTTNETTVQHTPGPWHLHNSAYGPQINTDDNTPIAKLHHANVGPRNDTDDDDVWPNEANARLITAAPDLLAALEEAHDVLAVALAWPGSERTRSKMRAAIAKAKGIQP